MVLHEEGEVIAIQGMKTWIIVLWLREHPDIFPDFEKARSGFAGIRTWLKGKRGRRVSSYFGWEIIAIYDPETGREITGDEHPLRPYPQR